eukprot:11842057-Prorocentrum_lima.AAC.1
MTSGVGCNTAWAGKWCTPNKGVTSILRMPGVLYVLHSLVSLTCWTWPIRVFPSVTLFKRFELYRVGSP